MTNPALWSLILLCFSMASSLGGGLYEHIVLTPYGVRRRHRRFRSQRGTWVPLQRFWIPVHTAITVFILLTLFLTWNDVAIRSLVRGSESLSM